MSSEYELIKKIILARRTEKVLAPLESRPPVSAGIEYNNKAIVLSAIETAGWAPFHYPRNIGGIAEPWRAHILWNASARALSRFLSEELQLKSKEPQLAAACGALVMINWIPEDTHGSPWQCEAPIVMRNEEHLAATSAMVQNFLLALTANEMGNYWSSGGKLRSQEVFNYLGIPLQERLLAAIFIEYPEMRKTNVSDTLRKPGANRDKRSLDWIRQVPL